MSSDFTLALAFATGLLGALHCLGMCSGIAGGFFVHYRRSTVVSPVLLYHGTRILTYTALGVTGAAIGRVLVQTGLIGKGQGILMMAAGALILLLGLDLLGGIPKRRRQTQAATPANGVVEVRMTTSRSAPVPWRPILAGTLNGLVPCGLVFSVAVKAAATADPARAGLLMAAFGLGTLPTMGLVSWSGAIVGKKAKGLFARLAGLFVVVLGLWTLYEGFLFFDIMRGLADW